MVRKFGQFSEEYIKQLEEFYINNPISLPELAEISGDEFGQPIPPELIKWYSYQGQWKLKKAQSMAGKEGLPQGIEDEVDLLKRALLTQCVDPEDPPGAKDLASMVTSYINLGKLGVARKAGSAKLSQQQVLDIARRTDGKRDSPDD